ncbi:outer membrane usher protein [Litorivivens lipolytica]|uniref:Outer membrane usher protein n=1 Tax=Litorivivens lipolytica TaxID=1524264 RepID=A0A7W4Z5V9_9GAMM|nr:fimbria/pilus outer membrane usher protein [Litorivivens lipolytica]MBB3047522.1 outer membrane usher protein [Litorivivens lipolytica]
MARSLNLLIFTSLLLGFSAQADWNELPWVETSTLSPQKIDLIIDGRTVRTDIRAILHGDSDVYLRAVDMLSAGLPIDLDGQVQVDGYPFLPLRSINGYRISLSKGALTLVSTQATKPNSPQTPEFAPFQGPRKSIPLGSRDVDSVKLRLILNQQDAERELTLLQHLDRWLISRDDLLALELPLPELAPLVIDGTLYLEIDNLWPYKVAIDPQWSLLSIDTRARPNTEQAEETWVELQVNESQQPRLVKVFADDEQQFLLDETTFAESKLQTPEAQSSSPDLYAIDDLNNVIPVFDSKRQALALYARSDAFIPSELSGNEDYLVEPDFSQRGALLNYALFSSHTDEKDQVSGQFEMGAFWGRGFLSSQHLIRNITDDDRENIRLETNLRVDWPEKMRSLIIGDTLNEGGAWGRPTRFGGLRWGTNFSTQPGFITFPTQLITGESVVPSTVDIFIDNSRRASSSIEPGAFTINEVPTVTGAGEMRIVTRDLFGRESVVTRPFYASSQLLKPGLHDYSYELGVIRNNFTRESNDYATDFASGTHRYGFSHWYTGEVRAELSSEVNSIGTAATVVWPAVAEFNFALAGSRDADSLSGTLTSVGVRRQARQFSFGARGTWRSRHFQQLGTSPESELDAFESTGFASVGMGKYGGLSLSHIQRRKRNEADNEFATLQYSLSLPYNAHFSLSYLEPLDDVLERSASASISIPLGRSTSITSNARRQASTSRYRTQLRKNLPAGNGFGYQLAHEDGNSDRIEAGVNWRNPISHIQVQSSHLDTQTEYRTAVDGGVAFFGSRPYLTQRLNQSFALVEVPDLPDASIYRDNQLLARTNASGKAIVPGLRDYQRNRIRLGDTKLPLDIQVASLEQIAVPAYRQGVKIRFSIKKARWVGFRLLDNSGNPAPSGTQFLNPATGEKSQTGIAGQAYIESPPGDHEMQAWWQDTFCRFRLNVPAASEPLPDLGDITCL